jgi:hypothetical protein
MPEKLAAVLIVNGGADPHRWMWLDLCLEKAISLNTARGVRFYVWNNNVGDERVRALKELHPEIQVVDADPHEDLAHVHAVPLQRLLNTAVSDGAHYVIAMDSDAHPVKRGWASGLIDAVEQGADASGVWRDELSPTVSPYLHASCLCTSVDFILGNDIRFDRVPGESESGVLDTLCEITLRSEETGGHIQKLVRSNSRQYHRLVGGIYGGVIYHHGAGSRGAPIFWDELTTNDPEVLRKALSHNRRLGEISSYLLFSRYDSYVAWLKGDCVDEETDRMMGLLRDGHLNAPEFREIPSAMSGGIAQKFGRLWRRGSLRAKRLFSFR